MDFYQLQTFVAVAREGSITRASECLHLSQPAVSAHIKAIEDTLGLVLFERMPRGMNLTADGLRLLAKAEQTLAAHRELLEEATRIKGHSRGTLRLGTASNSSAEALGRLLTVLSERYPDVQVSLQHGTSLDIMKGVRSGRLDAGFYNDVGESDAELALIEVAHFDIYLVAPPGLVATSQPLDWAAIARLPWICPTSSSSCCGRAAENLFERHQVRPQRIINIDRENVTRTLVAGGVGVGLLHAETARAAQFDGEVEIVCEAQKSVRVLFAHLASRARDPLLVAVDSIVSEP